MRPSALAVLGSIRTASPSRSRCSGKQRCKTPEELKACGHNLGHEHVTTTLSSYGSVSEHRQAEIIKAHLPRLQARAEYF